MKLRTVIYISLLAILCMLSCSRHSVHWETLAQVETFIEEQPDSALAALQRIDAQELAGKEERAKYALLLSMALDKNYVDKADFEVLQLCMLDVWDWCPLWIRPLAITLLSFLVSTLSLGLPIVFVGSKRLGGDMISDWNNSIVYEKK